MTTAARSQQPPSSVLETIAQIRFPALLTISSVPPAAFQERVRAQFPQFGQSQDRQAYVFQSSDQQWMLTLGVDSLALVGRRDEGWDAFKARWNMAVQALGAIYRPQHLVRVGVRIRNVIRRSIYDLADVEWSQLLHPHLAATCSWPELGDKVEMSRGEFVVALSGGQDRLRVGHGFLLVEGPRGDHREVCYLVDEDVYAETPMTVAEAVNRLDRFHWEARKAFRHCLTERLAKAMGASEVVEQKAA